MGLKGEVYISEGKRPIWQLIIASVLFTLGLILLLMAFTDYELIQVEGRTHGFDFGALWVSLFCFSNGLVFSVVQNLHFDLTHKKLKKEYSLGPIKWGVWRSLPKIEYISIFKQLKKNGKYVYEVNFWHGGNKHFNVYESLDKRACLEMGKIMAQRLHLDILDATEANNYKWLDV
ncbi:MAG: hypothetical protein AB3N16_13415 [Flavobacteriaceae bacterium]